jgi:hypothetical protein
MKYAKDPYVNGIKVFNRLPQTIKNLEHSPVKFKNALKKKISISTPFTQSRNILNKGILQGDHLNKGIFLSDLFLAIFICYTGYLHLFFPILGIASLQNSFIVSSVSCLLQ